LLEPKVSKKEKKIPLGIFKIIRGYLEDPLYFFKGSLNNKTPSVSGRGFLYSIGLNYFFGAALSAADSSCFN
jgi:hypothetical protein